MGLGKEEHKSKVSFSSYHMEHTGAYCQHELSLLYGPWSYGRGRVCRRLKLLPFCTALFGRKSLCTAHTWVGSYARPPWGCCLGINYLRVFFTGDFSLFPCLFDHLYQYGFMLFILYSALQPSATLFCCSDCLSFGCCVSFRLVHVSLWHTPLSFFVLVCSWALLYFLALPDAPGSSCVLLAPVLDSVVSPRGPFIEEW